MFFSLDQFDLELPNVFVADALPHDLLSIVNDFLSEGFLVGSFRLNIVALS